MGHHGPPQPMRRRVVTGRRCSGGNCGGNASERAAGEDLGEDGPDRWAPSVSDGDAVMGWQAGSCAEMGWGCRRAGTAVKKAAHDDFSIFNPFSN
jgi:hypothetical protein